MTKEIQEATSDSVSTERALDLALEALEYIENNYMSLPKSGSEAINAIKQARSAPYVASPLVQSAEERSSVERGEPVAWKWHQAPVKTSWGHDMVVADLAIDKDNTVSVYCERDQTAKVVAMFTAPAARRQWVGLTDEEREAILDREFRQWWSRHDAVCRAIEAKLKEKNT